jgi:Fe-S cluster assembly protein SufD
VAAHLAEAASYVGRFEAARADLPGAALPWLAALRDDAITRLAETGFPDRRTEAWKYTDLRRVLRREFTPSPDPTPKDAAPGLSPWLLDGTDHLLVFVDGRFAPDLSRLADLPDGVRITSLGRAIADDPAALEAEMADIGTPEGGGLVALNTAFMADGAVLRLKPGTEIAAPVQFLFLATAEAGDVLVQPRSLVIAGEGSRATIVETHAALGEAANWTNAVCDIVVGAGARIRHFKLQLESPAAFHISLTRVRVMADADYSMFVYSTGGRLARNEFAVRLVGDGASCRLDGATLIAGRQHVDNTTVVEHAARHGTSHQHFRSVIDGNARSVFQGRVLVQPDAQHTDASQTNRNLLLSGGAEADSKPELVIHADDVKCSHGATTGDLDQDALFYLRARGIEPDIARAMLVEAFMAELVEGIPEPRIRTYIAGFLAGALRREAA